MLIPISEITVNTGRREVFPENVRKLADSILEVGLLNPIIVDHTHILIAGLHRLEAVKLLGWSEINCTVSSLEGLQAELAEIDENLVRHELHYMDEGKKLARRKEIYEMLHPEAGQGKRNGQTSKTALGAVLEVKSFADDASEKLGIAPRTIREKIQVAKNMTPEMEEIVKTNHLGMKTALKLSRLEPEQQKDVAALAAGDIHSLDKYLRPQAEPEPAETEPALNQTEPEQPPEPVPPAPVVPYTINSRHFASFEESVADLKNPNKDCSYTPDSLLAELDSFIRKFHKEFAWYKDPFCTVVFPDISPVQLDYLKLRFKIITDDIHDLLKQMKRSMKK